MALRASSSALAFLAGVSMGFPCAAETAFAELLWAPPGPVEDPGKDDPADDPDAGSLNTSSYCSGERISPSMTGSGIPVVSANTFHDAFK